MVVNKETVQRSYKFLKVGYWIRYSRFWSVCRKYCSRPAKAS